MMQHSLMRRMALAAFFIVAMETLSTGQSAGPIAISPAHLPRIGSVSDRYQSYNIEMVEVTGGRFWAPYKPAANGPAAAADIKPAGTPAGMNPSLYRYRAPIDLGNPQLRKLAAALSPAYVRVSGTWANSTYFDDSDGPAPAAPPAGFGDVLTGKEWRGVIDFSRAVNDRIVTSFAISPGVRNADGVWTPAEAEKVLAFTKRAGGQIAGVEFFNEPTFASMGGAPKGYDAEQYGRDFKIFAAFIKKTVPQTRILGPDSVGEGGSLGQQPAAMKMIQTADMLKAEGPGLDVFAYHFYGGVSQRCAAMGAAAKTSPAEALSREWLMGTAKEQAFYAALRDRFEPGMPMWLTETAETACGGNPWAASFVDSFRYLNQLGVLATHGVQVVMHNTLAASDYGLLDEATLQPRPNYWSAVLWRRLMGATVLDAGPSQAPNLYVYAHCLRNQPGGVALLALNADRSATSAISLPMASTRYMLTATDLLGGSVALNGGNLTLTPTGDLPALQGAATPASSIALPPASITFLAIPGAGNKSCR